MGQQDYQNNHRSNEAETIKNAIEFLKKQGVTDETKAVACARLGSPSPTIKYGKINKIKDEEYGKAPYCLIIPAKLHFMEEEALEKFV